MPSDSHSPRLYHGVMISSTFTDLEHHRAALIQALKGEGLTDLAMENDSAKVVDVIDSSLQMVRDASAYVALISHTYGQTPVCPDRNPQKLSITELEFNEAQRLDRPILLFIMDDNHPVRPGDVESNQAKRRKLNAFRERAKKMGPDLQVHRVYATFDSLEDFAVKAVQAVAGLRRYLDEVFPTSRPLLPVRLLEPQIRRSSVASEVVDLRELLGQLESDDKVPPADLKLQHLLRSVLEDNRRLREENEKLKIGEAERQELKLVVSQVQFLTKRDLR